MKNHIISLRIDENTYKELCDNAKSSNMNRSKYIMSLINCNKPEVKVGSKELMESICSLYIAVSDGGYEDDDRLMKELRKLCRILS